MRKWRARIKTWTVSVSALHRYIRNDPQHRIVCLRDGEHVTNDPDRLADLLQDCWGKLETWPTEHACDEALESIRELYSLFAPQRMMDIHLTGRRLMGQLSLMRKTSPGVDSWTLSEPRLLPRDAWESLADLLSLESYQREIEGRPGSTLLLVFKRVPIPKTERVPVPSELRPLNIFSTVTRLAASTVCAVLTSCTRSVVHESQYAVSGEVVVAVSKYATLTELPALNAYPIYVATIDFQKLEVDLP